MKVLVQRHGIVIKTVPVSGERASIGSGAESDIVIDDPYLPAHLADLVRQPDGWHMLDAATSLDGVLRDGSRIEDDRVTSNTVYSVGGFELLVQLDDAPQAEAPRGGGTYLPTVAEQIEVPRTMMEPAPDLRGDREIPKTMFETPMPAAAPAKRPPAQLIQPPIPPSRAAAQAERGSPGKPKPRRMVIIVTALALGILLLLIVAVGKGGKKKTPPKEVATSTAPATTTATATATASQAAPAQPEQLLEQLKYDEALSAWETQLSQPNADAALRQRYADVALEVARIHAANGSSAATRYYEKVAQYGPPDSEAVAEAKKKLGR